MKPSTMIKFPYVATSVCDLLAKPVADQATEDSEDSDPPAGDGEE
jgi:hypothetical protein